MKKTESPVNKTLAKEIKRLFIQLITDLDKAKDADLFFRDFLTAAEMDTLVKRLAIAYWLKKGRSYENIKKNLKVSTKVAGSVKKLMGKEGVKLALKKVEAEEWANKWAGRIRRIIK
ncbi:hypothetical protein A3A76_04835 [Candidatus Woesebacteria bacterium RIFCSPLOWO2_01_FULL_39_23]|uniref:TrpR-related protein YerC/YecD n=2 Tax=Microgenomates group TaxID=1794810 RepID=A0A0H4T742_9BACT|nr:TrpR-related protein YerC/YecD [uncultured Microgenomates bacterium Rifle_16ft_4_minimus_37633]OGM13808.1 MAG: hypothetical protein A2141_04060 [Candidatus Woesebacteria bacterium RBG_16_40_11]OGM27758.1 MAG: hypothetical protein A2628_05055 [Candidatus Woesebacteria bacterium RIFCSPHIGHO2_01_FULL_40_22]OGM36024.1 MAG: hypothetical protein A3E41_01310 [Candidatus Woesebacteria bacterium RIFCSPHIGHO2_12_FULL_38_9]OGM62180.1 MAG: hypothetical protein A3A76_04835 [Candidatus Woesebacteria bacte